MKWFLPDEAAQIAFGASLAAVVQPPALIYLEGNLGAGKTTLVRGFLQQLGHRGNVKSPTYTLIEPYALPQVSCYHLDLYRLADGEELEYLGLREILAEQAVLLVEWPQRGAGWLPEPDLQLQINPRDEGRELTLSAHSAPGQCVLEQMQNQKFD